MPCHRRRRTFRHFRAAQFHQRAVRGEILSDESGRLYEKLGRQIRPIHQLASSQFGEAIDLVPNPPAPTRMMKPAAETNAVQPSMKSEVQTREEDAPASAEASKSEFVPIRKPATQQPSSVVERFTKPVEEIDREQLTAFCDARQLAADGRHRAPANGCGWAARCVRCASCPAPARPRSRSR